MLLRMLKLLRGSDMVIFNVFPVLAISYQPYTDGDTVYRDDYMYQDYEFTEPRISGRLLTITIAWLTTYRIFTWKFPQIAGQ